MSLFDIEKVSIGLCKRAQIRTMRQIRRSNLCTCQVLHILEIQMIRTVIEHVDHFVGEYTLNVTSTLRRILADDNLILLRIIAAGDGIIAYFAGDVATYIEWTVWGREGKI